LDEAVEETVIVTPSPIIADSIRSSIDSKYDVVTIAKFISNYLEFFNIDLGDQYKNKSQLMTELILVWKTLNPNLGYEEFKKSFNLFTDLRSYSVDFDTISSVLHEYDETQKNSVLAYYQYLSTQQIHEEHSRYFLLSESIREYSVDLIENKRNIIFVGFTFLSATQVDLVKALSILHNVYIPFPKEVYELSTDADWIKWLEDYKTKKNLVDSKPIRKPLKTSYFSKKNLSSALKAKNDNTSGDVLFLSKRSKINEFFATAVKESYFKTKSSLLENPLERIFKEIENEYFPDIDSSVIATDLLLFLKSELKIKMQKQDFLGIKSCTLCLNIFSNYIEKSVRNSEFSLIDFKLMKEVALLDAPRTSFSVLSQNKSQSKIYDLSNLDEIDRRSTRPLYICACSEFASLGASDKTYTETVESMLFEIGPIRRGAFEFAINKQQIVEKFDDSVELIMETNLLNTDLHLNSIFSDYELDEMHLPKTYFQNPIEESLNVEPIDVRDISVTRLQSYIECPRKYYLSHIDKRSLFIEFDSTLKAVDLGRIEHKVIEEYFKLQNEWNEEVFQSVVNSQLAIAIETRSIEETSIMSAEIEVYEYARNGVEYILKMLETEPSLELYFEKDFKKDGELLRIGRADCIGLTANKIFIIDFKRSQGSIPSKKEIETFNKIQTWFYLNAINDQYSKTDIYIGYICLADLSESVFVSNMDEKKTWKQGKFYFLKTFEEAFEQYCEFEANVVTKLKEDMVFSVAPRDSKSCRYCDFSNICSRGIK
jgi:CRISPR/Cas system-associated exonuclease Cas4 (RecB family)